MGNNKRKKRPESQLKENKQEKKRKIISITALAVCVILIVGAVLFIALNDRIVASKLLKEISGFVEKENIEAIVVSNDTVGDPLKPGVQDVYENEEMAELKSALITVLKNSKYKETIEADKGLWKTKIVMYNATYSRNIYIDASSIYIYSQGRAIRYEVSKKAQNEFAVLLEYVGNTVD